MPDAFAASRKFEVPRYKLTFSAGLTKDSSNCVRAHLQQPSYLAENVFVATGLAYLDGVLYLIRKIFNST